MTALAFIFWETLTIGGSVYLYFFQGASGWWVVLGLFLGGAFNSVYRGK